MPKYAYLQTDAQCPWCGVVLTDMIWFQWGFAPGYGPQWEYVYKIGQPIYWKSCRDGTTPAWTYFFQKDQYGVNDVANLGDPAFRNLVVRDLAQHYLMESCQHCQQPLGGAALEISGGVIIRAWISKMGEFEGDETDIYLVEGSGTQRQLKAMSEWNDHSMDVRSDC